MDQVADVCRPGRTSAYFRSGPDAGSQIDVRVPVASTADAPATERCSRSDGLSAVDLHYRQSLRRFAARLVGDPGRGDEIAQEALLKLWQHPEKCKQSVASLRGWLFTVTRNLAYDELRCARRRHELLSDAHALLDRPVQDPCARVADTLAVRRALATLSREHREVIVHAYYRRDTTAAIATHLGIPAGTVKSRLHYALHALRDACAVQGITVGGG